MGLTSSSLSKKKAEVLKLSFQGDAAGVIELADAYPELLQFCSSGRTSCWHLAARAGAADVLAVLVSRAEDLKYRHCLEQRLSKQQLPKQQQQQEILIQEMVNARNCCFVTPLMMAAESGCADSVRLLLQQGANPWAVDDVGCSALHYAAGVDKPAIVSLLLGAAGDTGPVRGPNAPHTRYANVRNQAGLTAVHYAVRASAAQALEVLLRGGANPGLVSFIDCMWEGLPRGSSPLHLAARKNDSGMAMQLLRAYAEQWQHRGQPDPRTVEDRTHLLPYQLALRHNNTQLAECLDPSTPLSSLFGDAATQELPASVLLGPASLAQLARGALSRKLEAELKSLQVQAQLVTSLLSQEGIEQGGVAALGP
ncbi:hypothetical protein OEZ85_003218 [Tetradesmus obliquus]|uniref:Uncharacterized protein n=1 Tax=Tetradesmus obliquus TaxID=3088 RepID=A0ABY8U025_TETOB|nr:hypothetical protein OEZ85_003218 [Tetradesmus obliquus]